METNLFLEIVLSWLISHFLTMLDFSFPQGSKNSLGKYLVKCKCLIQMIQFTILYVANFQYMPLFLFCLCTYEFLRVGICDRKINDTDQRTWFLNQEFIMDSTRKRIMNNKRSSGNGIRLCILSTLINTRGC